MCRVPGQSEHGWAQRKQTKGDRRGDGAGLLQDPPRQQKHQHDGSRINQCDSEVNSRRSLPEHRHAHCIRGIGAGQLHVVGFLVRGDALEHELAGVGLFAFVALERHLAQPKPHKQRQRYILANDQSSMIWSKFLNHGFQAIKTNGDLTAKRTIRQRLNREIH
jgi:hypothetical protein